MNNIIVLGKLGFVVNMSSEKNKCTLRMFYTAFLARAYVPPAAGGGHGAAFTFFPLDFLLRGLSAKRRGTLIIHILSTRIKTMFRFKWIIHLRVFK